MNGEKKPKIIVVVGPTASGKTSLAIALAKECNGEVISADSRQVYRGLDIGTEKVTPEEMDGIPHHLIDCTDLTTAYNASDFKRDATRAIKTITEAGKVPIIAGGTFFYIQTLLERISTPEVAPNESLREELADCTPADLLEKLTALDPKRAASIEPENPRRLIRAIEVATALGSVPEPQTVNCPYEVLMIGIETEREQLRAKITNRIPHWLQPDFMTEISTLLENGLTVDRLHELGFEYQIGYQLFTHAISPEEASSQFLAKNWQYAKRQLTWLKRDKAIEWFKREDQAAIIDRARAWLG